MTLIKTALRVVLFPLALFFRKEFVAAWLFLLVLALFFAIATLCLSSDELCPRYPMPARTGDY